MTEYAQVIIDISSEALDHPFTYRIPEELKEQVLPGVVVQVPFGHSDHHRKGYVVGLIRQPSIQLSRIKPVISVCAGDQTSLSRLIAMADWMKQTYGSTSIQALRTVLPVKAKVERPAKRKVIRLLSAEEISGRLETLSLPRYKARIRILQILKENEELDYSQAVREYGMTPSVRQYLETEGIARVVQEEAYLPASSEEELPLTPKKTVLTPEQEAAAAMIREEWGLRENASPDPESNGQTNGTGRPVLLMGVTGSGKTMIYMELIREILKQGKQVIVLIPEISLTYQTVSRFRQQFNDQVSFIHSRLSQGERYEQFLLARKGKIRIMVGPRSALFTPFTNLGLIIIDEEQESSYKSEASPRYHAREAAVWRARQEGAYVLMGSATPSLESFYRAERGEYRLVTLSSRFASRPMAEAKIVDMREELKGGNRSLLSRFMIQELEQCLADGNQAMLFLNRRGYMGFISCRSCGYVVKCPHCDVSLTQHNDGRMICHYCGYETGVVQACPVCSSPWIGGFKAGTQQVEQTVKKMFPQARVLRMDYDTTRKKDSYEKILYSFEHHEADILIGTQMIVKGHDFPLVTLVGILAADLSLSGADYRSAERTFALVTQAAGRAGRGESCGRAVIQTYQPEHYSLIFASRQDYPAFYAQEIGFRTVMKYPPVSGLMAILGSGPGEDHLKTAMSFLRRYAERIGASRSIQVMGPAPAAVGKVKDVYHMILYIKHDSREVLTAVRNGLERYIDQNEGFGGLRIQYDMQ